MLKLLSLFFFACSAFLIWQRNVPLPPAPVPTSLSQPVSLSLPELGISLPVLTEPLTPKGVTYEPHGNNLVFYGHNWPNILKPFQKARVGQTIIIGYADGSSKHFEIKTLSVVSGTDISVLQPTTYNQQLILYTCTGFLDRDRLVATATPI
ncbi:MAG: hypothetical protein G01um101416_201 [Microgenomates group bacterium Gr01-1014_16]|nr:MAG: hypothetical protein G01um101416_201 [Microgenomates group bacterium Gr01-1014_16]